MLVGVRPGGTRIAVDANNLRRSFGWHVVGFTFDSKVRAFCNASLYVWYVRDEGMGIFNEMLDFLHKNC